MEHSTHALEGSGAAFDDPGAVLAVDTLARPTGSVTPFNRSTVAIAGPTFQKSTRINDGARP